MNILITGGASGLGEAITRKLAADPNNKVFFTYHRSAAKATAIEAEFNNAKGIQADFTNQDSLGALIAAMAGMDLQALVNNAISSHVVNHFHKIDTDYFTDSFAKNVAPTLAVTREAIKLFRKKKEGRIVTILTSGLINVPPMGWSEYNANKAYLASMVKTWAGENIAFNITSNAVSPSLMQTQLTSDMDERMMELAISSHPLKELLPPDDVAGAVSYLLQCSKHINGTNLVMNAGANML